MAALDIKKVIGELLGNGEKLTVAYVRSGRIACFAEGSHLATMNPNRSGIFVQVISEWASLHGIGPWGVVGFVSSMEAQLSGPIKS